MKKAILRNLPKAYEWICRDYDNELSFMEEKPQKRGRIMDWEKECTMEEYLYWSTYSNS